MYLGKVGNLLISFDKFSLFYTFRTQINYFGIILTDYYYISCKIHMVTECLFLYKSAEKSWYPFSSIFT